MRSIVLVEGPSDAAAVEALARRRGVDLAAAGVEVRALDGVTNFPRVVAELAAQDDAPRLAGLYDRAEERFVRRAVERAGLVGEGRGEGGPAAVGFFACDRDLEDELIRALGADRVVALIETQGEGRAFRTLGRQPDHAGRPVEALLHRFLGTTATRKIRYGTLLVDALDDDRVPAPLQRVLDHALA